MSDPEILESLERVKQVASLAGLKGEIDEERMQFQMLFVLDDDRKQAVFVRDRRSKSRKAITVFSPCLAVKKGLMSGLTKETAIELLQANQRLELARYGIWESEKETLVLASYDCLLDTLDPAEFHAAVWSVAFAADWFERRSGEKDRF